VEREYRPDPAHGPVYREGFRLFADLYDDLKGEFGRKP
jgi:hypothetical protein